MGKNNTTRWEQKCGCDCFTCPIANEQAAVDDARILLRFVVISYYVYIYIYYLKIDSNTILYTSTYRAPNSLGYCFLKPQY